MRALDPAALSDDDFDGLLAAVGMDGSSGSVLPERMAGVNALLDLAARALREALLVALLDRLSRPVPPMSDVEGVTPCVPPTSDSRERAW